MIDKLTRKLVDNYRNVADRAVASSVSLRLGAYELAIERITRAITERGVQ